MENMVKCHCPSCKAAIVQAHNATCASVAGKAKQRSYSEEVREQTIETYCGLQCGQNVKSKDDTYTVETAFQLTRKT